jgi:hypothetical protein
MVRIAAVRRRSNRTSTNQTGLLCKRAVSPSKALFGRRFKAAMKKTKPAQPPSEEFQRFQEFTKRLMAVPKKEIDQQKAKIRQAQGNEEKKSRVTVL